MDDWQTSDKCVGCIPQLPNIDVQVVETYHKLMTNDKT